MLKDSESFAEHLDVEVTSAIPLMLLEVLAVVVLSVVSFFIICTISYMVGDLIPEWHANDGMVKNLSLICLELTLTFTIFHQYFKLLKNVINGVFPKDVSETIYPEIFSIILMVISIYLFQESLLIRTKLLWVGIFGDRERETIITK